MTNQFNFSTIYVDKNAENDPIAQRVIGHFSYIQPQIIDDPESFRQELEKLSFSEGKRTIWLTHFKGNFLKPCPGTADSYRCCNYLVINETTNCPINCTYCILQGYISNPAITIYTNTGKIGREIRELSLKNPQRILRIGTGELTDSLALDPITRLSHDLISEVQSLPNVILELKSKTDFIDHILDLPPDKIVLSWSVNPRKLVESDEYKATAIEERLQAAERAAKKGFMIGLHFDPIIYLPEWRENYLQLIELIGNYVDPKQIAWISLGSLRYPPHLKETVQRNYPKSRIFSGEQISGIDGKTRYLRPLRMEMYRTIHHKLKEVLGDVFIYFCMESQDIWESIVNKAPINNLSVDWYFAESLHQKFPQFHFPEPKDEIYREEIVW